MNQEPQPQPLEQQGYVPPVDPMAPQPQSQPQPTVVQQPTATIVDPQMTQQTAPAYGQPPVVPPQKKNHAKVIILIVAIVAGLALLIGGAFVGWTMLTSVSKADYQQADDHAMTAVSKLSSLNLAVDEIAYLYDPTETQINNKVDTAKKALTEYKSAVDALKNDKALTRGDQVQTYKTYKEKSDKYVTILEAYIDSSKLVLVSTSECGKKADSSVATASDAMLNLDRCLTKLGAIKDVTDTDLKAQLDASISYLTEMKGYATQYSSTGSSDFMARSDIREKIYASQDTYTDKIKDYQSNIDKKLRDNDPADQLNALSQALLKKATSTT